LFGASLEPSGVAPFRCSTDFYQGYFMNRKMILSMIVIVASILLASMPVFAKGKPKANPSKTCQSKSEGVDRDELQRQINDYKEQLDQFDQRELESENFDHALFEKVRSTYDREIRRLEKLKSNG
jgi:hypothetical protein